MPTKRDMARRHALDFGATEEEADFAGRLAVSEATHKKISSMLETLPREALISSMAGLILAVTGFDEEEAVEQAARMMNLFDRVATGRGD